MKKSNQTPSYVLSIALHALLLLGMFVYQQHKAAGQMNYVEVGFGEGGPGGSPGDGSNQFGVVNVSQPQPANADNTNDEEKKDAKIDLTKSTNRKSDDAVIADKNESRSASGTSLPSKGSGKPGKGFGGGDGNGTGYDIDWGGNGQRRIYSYNIPEYPSGVNKELDIKIRFSILPDGTVGRIIVLTKGDTRLENTAVNALRQWRFEPIHAGQPSMDQTVVIVFPFRLR